MDFMPSGIISSAGNAEEDKKQVIFISVCDKSCWVELLETREVLHEKSITPPRNSDDFTATNLLQTIAALALIQCCS